MESVTKFTLHKKNNKKKFKFSLIIPFYNSSIHLERCIKSVNKSYLIPNEIIVVDDFSNKSESKKCKVILNMY